MIPATQLPLYLLGSFEYETLLVLFFDFIYENFLLQGVADRSELFCLLELYYVLFKKKSDNVRLNV